MSPAEIERWCLDAACRDLIARAAQRADAGDHEGFAALFTQDAVLERPGGQRLVGRTAILAAYRVRPAGRITRHLIGGTVVDPRDAERADVSTTLTLWSGDADDAAGLHGRPVRGAVVVGEFEDLVVRDGDGTWRIAWRRARFVLHRDAPPAAAAP